MAQLLIGLGVSAGTAGIISGAASALLTVASVAASIALQLTQKPPEQVGPRLDDLRITGSAYGIPIPGAFGRVRLAGNMIWATEIEEVKKKQSAGGKGGMFGGGSKVTTFSYFGNFAMGFAEGPAKCFTRIWADKKLIFDLTGASDAFFKYPGASIRCYLGTETQTADPLIQADKGAADTPAFRGMVYIVVEGLPLKDFGNRIPNIEAEVDFNTAATSSVDTTANSVQFAPQDHRQSPTRRQLYYVRLNGGANIAEIGRIDMEANDLEIRELGEDTTNNLYRAQLGGTGLNPEGIYPHADGKLWVEGSISTGLFDRVVEINPYTLEFIQSGSEMASDGPFQQEPSISFTRSNPMGLFNFMLMVFHGDTALATDETVIHLIDRDNGDGRDTINFENSGTGPFDFVKIRSAAADRDGVVWIVGVDPKIPADGSGRQAVLIRVQADQETGLLGTTASMKWNQTDIAPLNVHDAGYVTYDEASHSLIIFGREDGTGKFHFIKWDIATRAVLLDRELDATADVDLLILTAAASIQARQSMQQGTMNGFAYYVGSTDKTVKLRANDLTTTIIASPTNSSDDIYFDVQSNSAWYFPLTSPTGDIERVLYDRCPFVLTPLEDVLTGLIEKTNLLTASDIDVTDAGITAQDVRGYLLENRSGVRNFLERLVFPYNFDLIESDVLTFKARGGSSVRTIVEDDLGARSGGNGESNKLVIDRSQEQEVPEEVAFTYLDPDRDQQQGTQLDRRHSDPNPTQFSEQRVQISIPIVFLPDEATQAVEKGLFNAWVARTRYEYRLGPKHLDLDPGDIVTVQRDGVDFVNRINQIEMGAGFELDVRAASEDAETYSSAALGASVPVTPQTVVIPGSTELFVLDIPLLRDADDGNQTASGLYVGGGALKAGWSAAFVERSIEGGSNYRQFALLDDDAPWGYLTADMVAVPLDAKGDYDDRLVSFDRVETIQVHIVQGSSELASVTELEIEHGANSFVIGEGLGAEVVSVATVVDNGGGSFSLSVLIRGRRGTEEAAVAGHTAGERVVFVTEDNLRRKGIELNRIGEVDFYRATTLGTLADDSAQVSLAHAGNDLKPITVAHPRANPLHTGSARGAVTVTWTRRSRLGYERDLDNGVTEIPLGETVEEYEVVLLDKATGLVESVVKTATDDATGVTFDLTDIVTTAGYTDGDLLNVVIYQKSGLAEVGRGYARPVSL